MLFDKTEYFIYDFPAPQYLGSKYLLRDWIGEFIPSDSRVALDAFSGSQSIAFLFKQLGKKTYTNDFLNFNHQKGIALIENRDVLLDDKDVNVLFSENPDKGIFNLFETLFTDLFFTRSEAQLIDSYRGNVMRLSNPVKRSMAIAVMCRCLTRKVTMGHFAHTVAMSYASCPERIKRNRSLVRPLRKIFDDVLPSYNNAVFDNAQDNKSFNENILELLPKMHNVDLVYFDPPYCDSHADYQAFYHLLETFSMYWKDKDFVNGTKRYDPKRYSGFDKKAEVVGNMKELFRLSSHIPYWIVSYNDRSYPSIEMLISMISPYRQVQVEQRVYRNGRGGKGSVAGSREILLICKPY